MGSADGFHWTGWREGAHDVETAAHPDAPPDHPAPDAEVAAIFRRAAAMGIPAWRVGAALGRPLPRGDER